MVAKFEGDIGGPLLRAPANQLGDTLGKRELRAQEITSFLRETLAPAVEQSGLARGSSHYLKRTMLTWCAKHSADEYSRSVLGRHIGHGQALYAMDPATDSARKLQKVILDISLRTIQPGCRPCELLSIAGSPCRSP